ncbi:hypothetical protein NLX83_21455 [Allokutzneria sp. A3M-2-11 16]|uniref:hypothetical protein n=1 Tax=Allokutzneria sp. A3M-2-11 16 TaxID=2962043 RepID=UPI0020B6F9D0|nr:hypothetical protein [Allokutzneria sp. A3M-2-11 16]MCP3801836.1 hypothetical protein [Allokutzneria sp. A3M-2-11 16]
MPETPTRTTPSGPTEVELDEHRAVIELIGQVRAQRERLAAVLTTLETSVKARMGEAEVGTLDGEPVVRWTATLRTSLSQRLVKALHPQVVTECLETQRVRTFRWVSR